MLVIEKEKFVCPQCSREFDSKRGLGNHKSWCDGNRAKPRRKPCTEEARKNIAISLVGRKLSKEHIESLKRSHPRQPVETRICSAPWCDNTFECRANSDRRFCTQSCGNKYTAKRVSRENRICPTCGCSFECRVTSTQKFCGVACLNHFESGYITLSRLGITLRYRSSYEKTASLFLDECLDVVHVSYEPIRIDYEDKGVYHKYVPDYVVEIENSLLCIVEVKPISFLKDRINQLKFEVAYKYAWEHDMIFLILTEDILFNNNGVTTTLAEVIQSATAAIPERDDDIV